MLFNFDKDDALMIKGILISPKSQRDIFTWDMMDNGVFSVMTVYLLSYTIFYDHRNLCKVVNFFTVVLVSETPIEGSAYSDELHEKTCRCEVLLLILKVQSLHSHRRVRIMNF